ncbi:PDR/VanB family oxidoreductase [Phaeacidiphilus oryzae]|uniref:PDR/VanB family oxidoreductase n=1 Tax=Phaeacidiphilus oryzae TaxID=348818 RepID=UPI00055DC0BC|nr:PDR/VanB family oxidoreductase [Phaeacidiphilus oryzae]
MSKTADEAATALVVTDRQEPAEGVAVLTLRPADGAAPLPPWTPGAHLDLLLADGLVRQYSLCGDPGAGAASDGWRIAVLREPESRGGSAYVHEKLTPGTVVDSRGPRNNFPLEPAPRYRFVAGGIGITPLLPMLAAAEAAGADWRLLYGGRRRASMAFLDELARYGDKVAVRPQDEYGLLDLPAFLGEDSADALVYCCGPEPLLAAAERTVPEGALRVERFSPKEPVGGGADTAFEVVLSASGRSLTVPADRSVLETLEEAGVDILSSCREGTCGTCETGVLDGVPDHRDSLLTPAEQAAGDTMFVCVSRCRGSRLVLDL